MESVRAWQSRECQQALDRMLETAREKFLDPDESVRREALKELWNAWERMKTIEAGKDKLSQTKALLDRVSDSAKPKFREMLNDESDSLTKIGNKFLIRHSETNQELLQSSVHVDYLFHRMFSFIRFLLTTTGRGG